MPLYFITYIILFWIPVFILAGFLWKGMDEATRKAFWITVAIMSGLTFAMEYVYIWLDVWTFTQSVDPLIGIRIWGVPIEEFEFWFGASPLFMLLYLAFDRCWPNSVKKESTHA